MERQNGLFMTSRNLDVPMYDHTQPGTVIRVLCIVIMLWLVGVAVLSTWMLYLVAGIVFLLMLIFHALNVRIDEDGMHLRFGVGLLRKSIPLESVDSCRVVRNSLMYGFGIRYVFDGWMWNVSGLDAVQLIFTNGKHFRIGTDEPAALAAAINKAIGAPMNKDIAAS
jgi:hypothetical protein